MTENEDSPRTLAIKLLKKCDERDAQKMAKQLHVTEKSTNKKSPKALTNLLKAKSPQKPIKTKSPQKHLKALPKATKKGIETNIDSNVITSPLADILYITNPLPLNHNKSGNAQVLKYEEIIGNPLKAILNNKPQDRLKEKYTELTPTRQHIVSKTFRKDISQQFANVPLANKENVAQHNQENTDTLSDTLSVCESMLEEQFDGMTIEEQNLFDNATYDKNLNSNRKRSRQSIIPNDNESSTQLTNDLQIETTNAFNTPPRNQQLPPYNMDKVSVLQSKSRLHGMVPEEKSPIHKSRSLLGDGQPKTPSPNKYSPVSSTFSSPRYCSSKSEMGHNECCSDVCVSNRPRSRTRSRSVSPTLLGQCNSQCMGSLNDLRPNNCKVDITALKSSHAALSWESTKLRKNSTKNFTVKNMAHRKLVLKMNIIGPGFQVHIYFYRK